MGDLNIDTADKTKDTCNYLSDLCDTFSLTNIINGKTFQGTKRYIYRRVAYKQAKELSQDGHF